MKPDDLFLDNLDELARRIEPGRSEYDLLSAAAILRQLLLDAQPLIDHVNRQRRLKLTYRINVRPPMWQLAGGPTPITWSLEDGLDPETTLNSQPQDVTRDRLLSKTVMVHSGYEISVKDLIQHAANVKGGVHLDEPRTNKDKVLSEIASNLNIGGYSAGTRPMQAIGRIVLKALLPLRASIQQDPGAPSGGGGT